MKFFGRGRGKKHGSAVLSLNPKSNGRRENVFGKEAALS